MPKRILAFAFAFGALVLAACNNNSNPYGSATPTPGPTATLTPNPTNSTGLVQVYAAASALPNQPVDLSTPTAQGNPGTPLVTQTTNPSGVATFSNLTPGSTYCFSSTFQPTPGPTAPASPAPLPRTQSTCTNLWGAFANYAYVTFSF